MRNPARRAAATAAACVFLGLGATGCSETGAGFDLARLLQPSGPSPSPDPNSPANALRLLEWCYNNKAPSPQGKLFSDDFRWFCSPLDSAGAEWRVTPSGSPSTGISSSIRIRTTAGGMRRDAGTRASVRRCGSASGRPTATASRSQASRASTSCAGIRPRRPPKSAVAQRPVRWDSRPRKVRTPRGLAR